LLRLTLRFFFPSPPASFFFLPHRLLPLFPPLFSHALFFIGSWRNGFRLCPHGSVVPTTTSPFCNVLAPTPLLWLIWCGNFRGVNSPPSFFSCFPPFLLFLPRCHGLLMPLLTTFYSFCSVRVIPLTELPTPGPIFVRWCVRTPRSSCFFFPLGVFVIRLLILLLSPPLAWCGPIETVHGPHP